jgi:hypothetical protein
MLFAEVSAGQSNLIDRGVVVKLKVIAAPVEPAEDRGNRRTATANRGRGVARLTSIL